MTKQITLDDIVISITKKKIKNLHLKIYPPDGTVKISAPLWMNMDQINAFVLSKSDWIKQQRTFFQEQRREPSRAYLDQENHLVWGNPYVLNVIETAHRPKVDMQDNHLFLHIPIGANEEKRAMILHAWYRDQLKQAIPPLIAKWEPCMNVKVEQFFIQRMKTRWGSCNPRSRNIRLNTELAKKPFTCLEYVVIHEMVHLLEPSHNARFKSLMTEFMPQWRFHRGELNQSGLS
ncbi:MAG: M48 family metallopeptidase [Legionellales bacterium]|nr:M48 family metallopeptidase [Legionellales bacterium]